MCKFCPPFTTESCPNWLGELLSIDRRFTKPKRTIAQKWTIKNSSRTRIQQETVQTPSGPAGGSGPASTSTSTVSTTTGPLPLVVGLYTRQSHPLSLVILLPASGRLNWHWKSLWSLKRANSQIKKKNDLIIITNFLEFVNIRNNKLNWSYICFQGLLLKLQLPLL